ncbi:unnamed protein product [Prorocentrum cordatum]|uniref:Vacuolar-sorting protein SNF8 n=1 Tax=Prorocentrum cordatum TaxID=2364126 RepID=A0ABN9X573_9DINO|nr:unnamed protein product [Polarella glacialis]
MRRGPGIAGLKQSQAQRSTIAAAGDQSKAAQLADAKANFEVLRAKLTEFAQKHRSRINSDPQFRQAFCEMCAAAGVDPLASSKVLTVCIQTREMNGGLLDLRECLSLVQALRPADQTISEEDVETAISSLSALGRGVGVRRCGDRRIVYSVPDELNTDPSQALEIAARAGGKVCSEDLTRQLGWRPERAEAALAHFVREGLCWVDTQDPAVDMWYWFPSIALAGRS